MPSRSYDDTKVAEIEEPPMTELPFPPVQKSHILNCSFHSWHHKYRSVTPKSRCVPLNQSFLDYLRADGIILPPEPHPRIMAYQETSASSEWLDPDAYENDGDPNDADPSAPWAELHATIIQIIQELGGHVAPKLNWSAPKDATWINPTNSMNCPTANDIYLLLKSSDFVTHDLEHAFDGCVDHSSDLDRSVIPYHLILRKWIQGLHPSLEFRCFVRDKKLLALCQRDLNHYDFLPALKPHLVHVIRAFFDKELRETFPDPDFVFDVYIPPGADGKHARVWLVDVNPWAVRTDPILFSWWELLTMETPVDGDEDDGNLIEGVDFVRVPFRPASDGEVPAIEGLHLNGDSSLADSESASDNDSDAGLGGSRSAQGRSLELRLISHNDPEAHAFSTPQYSAHKLPRDVVDASSAAAAGDLDGVRDFAEEWRRLVARRNANGVAENVAGSDSDDH